MAELLFDANNQADTPTLILETKGGERYGSIDNIAGLSYIKNLNSADTVSFTVYKYSDGEINRLWDDITDLKTLYIPEYNEKFEVKISYEDEETETKSVTAASLCEAELSQIILRDFEVNTETDIARDDYRLTVFYDPDHPEASLLHRVLSAKASAYMDLEPVSFRYNNGSSGRKHFGFGAGQVRDTLEKHGFTTKDFAGFVQMKEDPGSRDYCGIEDPMGLVYTEFIAWNTHMIQQLMKRVAALEAEREVPGMENPDDTPGKQNR